jgi:hypothetical protein
MAWALGVDVMAQFVAGCDVFVYSTLFKIRPADACDTRLLD